MLFNSLEFLVFFALFLIGYVLLSVRKQRLPFLMIASLIFYSSWGWQYLPLLLLSTTIDFWLGRLLMRVTRFRKLLLAVSIAVNLSILCFYKYAGFLNQMVLDAADINLGLAGFTVLPLGISFWTFEGISYIVDVYRGETKAIKKFSHYLAFISFFPHLIAGPIVRCNQLLPQLLENKLPSLSREDVLKGLFLFLLGLIKKVILADRFAAVSDSVFQNYANLSSLEILSGVYAFAFQIYFDFSGYSDMAIGAALLIGIRLNENFNYPYLSASITEFWRRWHISLSAWLRDYLYISLGGNRKGRFRTYVNLLLTMLLGGLWHGANYTFIVWGALHGVMLAIERAFKLDKMAADLPIFKRIFRTILTFHFTCLCWIYFRAQNVTEANQLILGLVKGVPMQSSLIGVLPLLGIGLLIFLVMSISKDEEKGDGFTDFLARKPGIWIPACLLLILFFRYAGGETFIYFQF